MRRSGETEKKVDTNDGFRLQEPGNGSPSVLQIRFKIILPGQIVTNLIIQKFRDPRLQPANWKVHFRRQSYEVL